MVLRRRKSRAVSHVTTDDVRSQDTSGKAVVLAEYA